MKFDFKQIARYVSYVHISTHMNMMWSSGSYDSIYMYRTYDCSTQINKNIYNFLLSVLLQTARQTSPVLLLTTSNYAAVGQFCAKMDITSSLI